MPKQILKSQLLHHLDSNESFIQYEFKNLFLTLHDCIFYHLIPPEWLKTCPIHVILITLLCIFYSATQRLIAIIFKSGLMCNYMFFLRSKIFHSYKQDIFKPMKYFATFLISIIWIQADISFYTSKLQSISAIIYFHITKQG